MELVVRVFDPETKEMFSPDEICHLHMFQGKITVLTWKEQLVFRPIIMLWSGLLDKNGTRIFEGDIVRYTIQRDPQIYPEVVQFTPKEGGFNLFAQTTDPYFRVDLNSIEVIGNIYQNPELASKDRSIDVKELIENAS